ncbi:MAG: SufD family Fe-S cluster assembly protein [Elusimicrobia bacterium]|nr:SufD family Fe-S cluster assembly protein [Elusimicrobiota bacterium]
MTTTAETSPLLQNFRQQGRETFECLPWPDSKHDIYKRSDLRFLRNGFSFIPQKTMIQTSLDGPQSVFHGLSDLSGASLEIAQKHLGSLLRADHGKFEAFNAAHAHDGLVVAVPEGIHLKKPLSVSWNCATDLAQGCFFPRLLLVAGPGSRSIYLERWNGGGAHPSMVTSVAEIVIEDGAELLYVINQNFGHRVQNLAFQGIHLGQGAKLHLFHWEHGAGLRHLQIHSIAQAPESEFILTGAVLAQNRQTFDTRVNHTHQAARTTCNMLWKTALKDHARGSFFGLLKIAAGADGSQAYQAIHNLHLSAQAQSIPDPRLEILANDVIAKHASTAGYLDEEQLFYLNSRGIGDEEAERILTSGFLQETAGRLESPWRDQMLQEFKEALHVD